MADKVPNQKKPSNWGRVSKTAAFWLLIILIPIAFVQLQDARSDAAPSISYTRYDQELQRDNVRKVTIRAGKLIQGEFRTPVSVEGREVRRFNVQLPVQDSELEIYRLRQKGVLIEAQDVRTSPLTYFVQSLPWLV